jgi:hypothetical protein
MLTIIAVILPASFVVGWLAGGRVGNIEHVKIRYPFLGLGALGAGLLPLLFNLPDEVATILLFVAYAMIAMFLGLNIRARLGMLRIAILVLLLGWLLNAAPIVANGAMPLSLSAYEKSGLNEKPTPRQGGFYKITLASDKTRLNWLGDAIAIRAIRQVVSIGDLVLVLGIGLFLVGSMRNSADVSQSTQR